MSVLTKSQFDTLYNQSGSGTFLDNSTQSIVEASMRAFAKDILDSFFNLSDNKYSGAAGVYLNITDTTGLKAITTVGVTVGFIILFRDSSGGLNAYKLLAGTDAESLPDVVRPTDYAGGTNEKVWKIASTTSSTITSGTYSPTLTGVTNIASSSASQCQYLRVGNVVTVSGSINIQTTATGPSELGISLPIASNFSIASNCGGMANNGTTTGYINGDTTNDRGDMNWTSVSTSNLVWVIHFTYYII